MTGILFDSRDSGGGGGLEKWPVTIGFTLGDRPFFQTPLNLLSQIVLHVNLVTSHYLFTSLTKMQK